MSGIPSDFSIDLSGGRVLVTGGTGFIGGRLVERLVLDCGARVRVLVSNLSNACRIARFPVEIVRGDVADPAAVAVAARECDLIFHCAVGTRGTDEDQRRVTVGGTENVVQAGIERRVKRLVYLSSLMVYGNTADGDLDESAPMRPLGATYADCKLEAERRVLDAVRNKGLAASILQPSNVYGPYSPHYTVRIIRALKKGRPILVNGGSGLANLVYVDDVVQAMLRAAVREEAVGESFLISGEEPVTWADFYRRLEELVGVPGAAVAMTEKEARAYDKRLRKEKGTLRTFLRALRERPSLQRRVLGLPLGKVALKSAAYLFPGEFEWVRRSLEASNGRRSRAEKDGADEKPILPIPPEYIPFFASRTRVRIDKAKRLLGYRPRYDFDRGMELVEAWAVWANLVERRTPDNHRPVASGDLVSTP